MKRLIALLLTVCLLFGTLPAAALAESADAFLANTSASSTALPADAADSLPKESPGSVPEQPNPVTNSAPPESSVLGGAAAAESASPLAAPAPAAAPVSATLRIELYDSTWLLPTKFTMPDKYKPLADYGFTVKQDPGYFTPLHLLAEYCSAQGLDPAESIEVTPTGFVTNILGMKGSNNRLEGGALFSDTSFMFAVNDAYPARENGVGYTLADYPLAEGDTVVLYDMWFSSATVGGHYAYFTQKTLSGYTGDPIPLEMRGFFGMTGTSASMKGAELLFYDANGSELTDADAVGENVKADGTASAICLKPGTYIVSAKRLSGFYHNFSTLSACDISRPYALVTITDPPPLTDAEAVAYDKSVLSLGDLSAVTGNLALPSAGRRGTAISWQSDSDSISADGTVTRPAYPLPDKTVRLTATIRRGAETAEKEFSVTVKAVNKTEAEQQLKDDIDRLSVSSSFFPTTQFPGAEANLLSLWQKAFSDKGYQNVSVSILATKNPNIAEDGSIIFNQYYCKAPVTLHFERAGASCDKTVTCTVSTKTLTAQEKVDTVAELLTFDAIKGSNTDAAFVSKSLSSIKSMTGYSGVGIAWKSDSPAVAVGSYSHSVKRPALGQPDVPVVLTATVSLSGASAKTKDIPFTVGAYSTALATLRVSAGALDFSPDATSYTVHLPQNAQTLVVTAQPRDPSVTTFSIGSSSFSYNGSKEQAVTIPLAGLSTEVSIQVTCGGTVGSTALALVRDLPEAPSVSAFWGGFRKDGSANAVLTGNKTPAEETAALVWEARAAETSGLTSYPGSPLVVGGKLYIARDNKLLRLDAGTGHVEKEVTLSGEIGYAAMAAYAEGQIFVPLTGGVVECIDAAAMRSLWRTTALGGSSLQALAPVSYLHGKVFCGFYDYTSRSGMIAMLDPAAAPNTAGEKAWTTTFCAAGCYGSGAAAAAENIVLADESGTVSLLDANGKLLDTAPVDGAVRSLPVFAQNAIYLTTTKGSLYRFTADAGKLQQTAKAALPGASVCSPAVAGDTVFAVGGAFGTKGFCAAFDTATLHPRASLVTAGPIQSSPAAVYSSEGIALYAVQNSADGPLLRFVYDARQKTLTQQILYIPSVKNYATFSPVFTETGVLLYGNDSGILQALTLTPVPARPETTPGIPETILPTPGSNSGEGSQASPAAQPSATKKPLLPLERPQAAPQEAPAKTALFQISALEKSIAEGAPFCRIALSPETPISREMIAKLNAAADCTLVLDYSDYTISIKPGDFAVPESDFTIRLVSTPLSQTQQAKLGADAAGFELSVEGAKISGSFTVVLPYTGSAAFCYPLNEDGSTGAPVPVTLQDGYAMCTLQSVGSYLLASLEEEPVPAGSSPAKDFSVLPLVAFGGIAVSLLAAFLLLKKKTR